MLTNLWKNPSRFQLYASALLWAAIIFILSAQPSLPGPSVFALDFLIKKSAHITEYAMLFILVHVAVRYDIDKPIHASVIAILICIIYAMTDEYHQSFVQGRTATIRDVLYDTLGIFFAWLAKYKYI